MRLFIALNFNEKMKSDLYSVINRLEKFSEQGNFTRWENLHLTVHFIGETSNVKAIQSAMDTINMSPSDLVFKNLGRFKRNGGDIYWIGAERSEALEILHRDLFDALTERGFSLEKGKFKPHLTLGRRVILKKNFNKSEFEKDIPEMTAHIDRVSLMRSQRIQGKLVYTEIYGKNLK